MKFVKSYGLALISVIISILVLVNTLSLPSLKSKNVPLSEFSAFRAMEIIENIAQKPHPIESEENERVRNYLTDKLQGLGLNTEIQSKYVKNKMEKFNVEREGHVNNIIAKIEGSGDKEGAILLMSHYDSVDTSPGAADASSGVATIIETIRALKHKSVLKNDIIVLITDGEEKGLLGAAAFVKEDPLFNEVKVVVNLEARGNSGAVSMFETGEGNGNLIKAFSKSVPHPFAFSAISQIYKLMDNDTDYSEFRNRGVNGLNFANFDGAHTYHQFSDNIENYNKKTLQHYGENILNLMSCLGNKDLNQLINEKSNSIYFPLTKNIFVNYSENTALYLAIVILILFVSLIILVYKKGRIKPLKILLGTVVTLIILSITAFLIKIITSVNIELMLKGKNIQKFSSEWFELLYNTNVTNPYMLLYLGITIIIIITLLLVVKRYIDLIEIYIGNLLIWVGAMIYTSLFYKGLSYLFTWTTLVFILGMVANILLEKSKLKEILKGVSIFMSIFVSINIYGMFMYIVYLALQIRLSFVIMPLVALYLIGIISMVMEFSKISKTNIKLPAQGL